MKSSVKVALGLTVVALAALAIASFRLRSWRTPRRAIGEQPVYHYPVDPALKAELRLAYDQIAVAYSNRQTRTMRQIFDRVGGQIGPLLDKDFVDVCKPASLAVWDALFIQDGPRRDFRPPGDFSDVTAFSRYAYALLELVKIYGDVNVARHNYGHAMTFEGPLLRLLKAYRKKFAEEGRRDLETLADKLVSEWIAFIESDEGYSHRYARRALAENLALYERENKPREDAVMISRKVAVLGLQTFADYTPKWLNEIK